MIVIEPTYVSVVMQFIQFLIALLIEQKIIEQIFRCSSTKTLMADVSLLAAIIWPPSSCLKLNIQLLTYVFSCSHSHAARENYLVYDSSFRHYTVWLVALRMRAPSYADMMNIIICRLNAACIYVYVLRPIPLKAYIGGVVIMVGCTSRA